IPMYGEVSLIFNNKRNIEDRLDNRAAIVKGAQGAGLTAQGFEPRADFGGSLEFPFRLVTGNHLFHSGRLSRMSPSMAGLLSAAVVEISDEDAGALGLKNGDKVCVRGAAYEARMTLRTRKGSMKGVAFVAENFEDAPVGRFFRRGEGAPRVGITKI
ncbi:MAG: molybdopterin dinucleotide binding domain-containing protein, partial [Deltaproteobacteria bacterium]